MFYAAKQIAGLSPMQALDEVPYSWLLRFRTQMWYQDGIGAKPMFRPAGAQDDRGAIERMIS